MSELSANRNALLLLIALAAPASAQNEACIHVQTGTPYSAGIQVTYGDQSESTNPLTNPITPGATQCLPLTAVPDGVQFSVM